MRFQNGIFCGFLAFAPLLSCISYYIQGFSGGHLVFLILPLAFYIYFVALICLITEVFVNARDAIRGQFQIRNGILLGLSIITCTAFWFILPASSAVFLRGFTVRIEQTVTFDEVAKIASAAHQHIPDGDMLWHPSTPQGRNSENVRAWDALSVLSKLAMLPAPFTISNRKGVVTISWGGALVGHWGFRWAEGGLSRGERDYTFNQLPSDIAAFYAD